MAAVIAGETSFDSFLQLIGVLLIFLFVLVITYFTTRWIAGYQKGRTFQNNLKVIETLKITTNKYIQIVQAGEEFLVIAIGKDEIHLLSKLSKEQLKDIPAEVDTNVFQSDNFKEILDKFKERLPKK